MRAGVSKIRRFAVVPTFLVAVWSSGPVAALDLPGAMEIASSPESRLPLSGLLVSDRCLMDPVARAESSGDGGGGNYSLHPCPTSSAPATADFFASACSCQVGPTGTVTQMRKAEESTQSRARERDGIVDGRIQESAEFKAEMALRKRLVCEACLAKLSTPDITPDEFMDCRGLQAAGVPSSLGFTHGSEGDAFASILQSRGWRPPASSDSVPGLYIRSTPKYGRSRIARGHYEDFCRNGDLDFFSPGENLSRIEGGLWLGSLQAPNRFNATLPDQELISMDIKDGAGNRLPRFITKGLADRLAAEQERATRELFSEEQKVTLQSAFLAARDQASKTASKLHDPAKIPCPSQPAAPDAGCEAKRKKVQERRDAILAKLAATTWKPNNDPSDSEGSGASYSFATNEIRVSASWGDISKLNPDALQFVLLHEFGHAVKHAADENKQGAPTFSMSPMLIRLPGSTPSAAPSAPPAWTKVTPPGDSIEACLKSEASLGAHSHQEMHEAFADYFAVEAMTLKWGASTNNQSRYKKMGATLCDGGFAEDSEERHKDPHATSPERLNRMIAAHPVVRAAFGQKPLAADGNPRYCKEF